jgi:uncharacterized protein
VQASDAILARPAHRVADRAGVLTADEIAGLTKELEKLDQAGLAQGIIDIERALPPGAVLEDLTLRSANAWNVGRKDVKDGLVIFVFMADHQIRIELGRGLEAAISNAQAKSIIDEHMTPAFRQRKYAEGLTQAIHEIRELLRSHRASRTAKDTSRIDERRGTGGYLRACDFRRFAGTPLRLVVTGLVV